MIILRVAMGRGWLKETVNEFNTALVFTKPTMAYEQSRTVSVTIHSIEGPICDPGIPAESSDTSIRNSMNRSSVVSIV